MLASRITDFIIIWWKISRKINKSQRFKIEDKESFKKRCNKRRWRNRERFQNTLSLICILPSSLKERDIDIVYVIESAAYGVICTSCLCKKPERARYERVRAFDTNNEVAYMYFFLNCKAFTVVFFQLDFFFSRVQQHFCHQLVWCQILGFHFAANAAPQLFETKHFLKSLVTLTFSMSCYTSILNFANYSGTCTDGLFRILCSFLVFHFHAILQQCCSGCLCIIWPTDALAWNQSLYT